MPPTTEALHNDILELKERTAMHDAILRGGGETPGVLTLLDRTARSVERVEASIAERDRVAMELMKEARAQKSGIMLVALSALATALLSGIGWLAAWVTGKVG